ncbi:hypothetical protein GIB67_016209 [Kingdonia uniflora]|uniref:Uncharacterized protein n=1 Tax=Kingdonia uniflora TaxID=39325 RepID=A0A7J7LTB1_9MAGN|nr:hypothetical protein GIB67_016209 [Kingdonia uniflora]
MELVIASSPSDSGIACWDLQSGAEQLRYKSCTSPPHGLTCVGGRFLASSQLRQSNSSSGSVLYWSWNRPQPEVKSFPAEPIKALVSNSDGAYIIGGGASGNIFVWEAVSGRLLKMWNAHYRAVTCLVFSEDESVLISGAEDGCVRVWIFDDIGMQAEACLYVHSFSEHTLSLTDIVSGYGGCNAIIISSSEDRTCKVWSVSKGKLLRNIIFPSVIDAIALDPGEDVFYAGSRDGKIYICALNAESDPNSKIGMHIIGAITDYSAAITCLSFSKDGVRLVSGSEDGTIRIWDTKSRQIVRRFKHSKGPVNNVLVVRTQAELENTGTSLSRKQALRLPPPLNKYTSSTDESVDLRPMTTLHSPSCGSLDAFYLSSHVMDLQVEQLQV